MRWIICRTLAILLCAMLCMNSALAESPVTATVSISVSGADLKLLTNLTIGDVEQPSEGKKLDQTAMVTSAEGIAWEIPVYWLDQTALVARADGTGWDTTLNQPVQKAVVTSAEGITWAIPMYWLDRSDHASGSFSSESGSVPVVLEGIIYSPVLAFYLPQGYTCDGTVTLDDYLSSVFHAQGNVVTFTSDVGITFITCLMTNTAPVVQRTAGIHDRPTQPSHPGEQSEPVIDNDAEDPYKSFAAAYTADHNVDIEALFESFGGFENTDWDALVRAFSYHDAFNELAYVVSDFNQQLLEYLDDDWGAWGSYNHPISDALERYKADELEKVPDDLRAYCDENTCLFVDPESLEDLREMIVNVIQPQAVNLLRERLPVVANAADNEMSKETGLSFIETSGPTADTDIHRDDTGFKSRIRIYVGSIAGEERDGRKYLLFQSDPGFYAHAIIHEDVHLFMSDYNRNGMFIDVTGYNRKMEIDYENWTFEYYYTIPDSDDRMNEEEFRAFRDSKQFPSWMMEGAAQLVAGFYQLKYSEELFDRTGTEVDGHLVFTAESVKAQYDSEIKSLDARGNGGLDADYCYGPLAMMYLVEKQLQTEGKTGLIRDENGALVGFDNAAMREGISEILDAMHTDKTLDDVLEDILGPGHSADEFGKQFIADGGETLYFCVDVLNCLEKQSEALGYRVSGGILYDEEQIPLNAIDWENSSAQSDFYQFSDSSDYVYSDVPQEIGDATQTKSNFDLEAYRQQHATAETDGDNEVRLMAARGEDTAPEELPEDAGKHDEEDELQEEPVPEQDGNVDQPEDSDPEQRENTELPEDAGKHDEENELPKEPVPEQDGNAGQPEDSDPEQRENTELPDDEIQPENPVDESPEDDCEQPEKHEQPDHEAQDENEISEQVIEDNNDTSAKEH